MTMSKADIKEDILLLGVVTNFIQKLLDQLPFPRCSGCELLLGSPLTPRYLFVHYS